MTTKYERLGLLASSEPSRFLHHHVSKLDATLPVLDAPCGFGRNSLFLADQGYRVVGADIDGERVNFLRRRTSQDLSLAKKLNLIVCDLNEQVLPLRQAAFGSIVMVHFVPSHWNAYYSLLRPGGILVFETMGGQGQNYLELPVRGKIQTLLEPAFTILVHREQPVGPPEGNAVTVRLIARKR